MKLTDPKFQHFDWPSMREAIRAQTYRVSLRVEKERRDFLDFALTVILSIGAGLLLGMIIFFYGNT